MAGKRRRGPFQCSLTVLFLLAVQLLLLPSLFFRYHHSQPVATEGAPGGDDIETLLRQAEATTKSAQLFLEAHARRTEEIKSMSKKPPLEVRAPIKIRAAAPPPAQTLPEYPTAGHNERMEHETPEMRRPIEAVVSPAEAQENAAFSSDPICREFPAACRCDVLHPTTLIYNRIPKCGSGSMNVVRHASTLVMLTSP